MRNSENVAPVCVISEAEICDKLNEKKASRQYLSKIKGNQVFLLICFKAYFDMLIFNSYSQLIIMTSLIIIPLINSLLKVLSCSTDPKVFNTITTSGQLVQEI